MNSDPQKQVGYLQQCLSSDKKPLGLFLGAGCPVSVRIEDGKKALIPDIAGLTEVVRKRLSDGKETKPLLGILDKHFKEDCRNDTTVEDMLSHIRALRVVAGGSKVRDLSADDLDKLDADICQIIHELVDQALPSSETPYHSTAVWADAVPREIPVEIFTTNYDLLMEQAFEDRRVPYFDGFAGSLSPFFDIRAMEEDKLPPRWARLWKLHGSVNWFQHVEKGVLRGSSGKSDLPRVIHPSHLKYDESRRMPYLAMIDRLRAFLKQPSSALVLCGYSFRDDHLNEVIMQGLQSTQTAIAFALLYDKLEEYKKAKDLALGRPNLSLLARDGGLVSGQEVQWPEKDSESVPTNNMTGLDWPPIDPADEQGKRITHFTLGDFAELGKFLRELVGQSRQSLEATNAE
ncbi:SIR2 family NAD-dependent protein deacylase [Kiritimatiella glycovorans]|uniref:Uncharacterized protein n=1 Tax=Kiritimatiella glycovorans TaxID=1307763 RepID=A0A0G3EEJ6_9BACT|nr:SIR2 family protein [Kiritimatiella glycovorans]AKJ64778.1 hypothetical protein L21SP4_01533 [Kiritimatiella glycovorans]